MIEQGNRTQQLIYRTSYRKHKERLADIRHNVTANDFLPPRNHHSAKKPSQKMSIKKQEIQSGNFYMKSKLNAIKHRTNNKIDELFSTEQLRKQPKRYFDHSNEVKVQISSETKDGEHVKFILPSQKNPSSSLNAKIKDSQKVDIATAQAKMNSIEKSYKKFSSNIILKETQKDAKPAKQSQLFYNLPQRNQNRAVIYKKTLVFSSMQSCLLELSLINERLLIAAYLMGLENTTLRELYSLKRTTQLLKECENNYEQFCSRIFIEKANDKYQFIRIAPKQEENKEQQNTQQDKNKQKVKIQNDFIKRNYYTLVKTDEQQKEEPKDNKPLFTFDHVQAIVQRLAVPKRYFKQQRQEKIQRFKANSNYQKGSNYHHLSQQQLVQPEKKITIEKSRESQHSIKNVKQQIMKVSQKQSQKIIQSMNKKHQIEKNESKIASSTQKEKNVEQNYDDEYEQQFDNPSSIKNSKLHSVHEASKPLNNSIVSNQSKQSMKLKQSLKVSKKNESEIYEHQFQKEPEESYQQQFEEPNEAHSPVAKIANNSSIPPQNVEQQYEQEFAD